MILPLSNSHKLIRITHMIIPPAIYNIHRQMTLAQYIFMTLKEIPNTDARYNSFLIFLHRAIIIISIESRCIILTWGGFIIIVRFAYYQ